MKRALLLVALLSCTPTVGTSSSRPSFDASKPDIVWQEPFDEASPIGWGSPSGASAEVIAQIYSIKQEGDQRFLSARFQGAGSAAPPAVHWGMPWRDQPIPLTDACSLSWRWRVMEHPAADDDPWRDVAVSVYVVFALPGLFTKGKGYKFGWLNKPGPKGTTQRGLVQIALRNGGPTDTWQREQVDLCRLYSRHFGDPAEEKLIYVGVVSDGDDTESSAIGDYDDFVLSTAPVPPKTETKKP